MVSAVDEERMNSLCSYTGVMKKMLLLGIGLLALAFILLGAQNREVVATSPSVPPLANVTPSMTAGAPPPPLPNDTYPVAKVIDGDTISIIKDGKAVTLRLSGLDTPETVDPRNPVQCFGKEASEKAKQILTGTSVRIEMDPSQGELDKYGRLLAYVYVPADVRPEGILVNEYMIAEGYGHEYTYNLPYKYQAEFKAAERKAREEKKGLWADGACADDANTSTKTGPAVPPPATAGGGYECS